MRLSRLTLAAALTLALPAAALAAPTTGSGGGYYGGADYVGPGGMTVGPYATYAECNAALQAGIAYHVANHGEVVETVYPCSYRPPYSIANPDVGFEVELGDGGSTGGDPGGVLADYTRLRQRFNIDRFDAEVEAVRQRKR